TSTGVPIARPKRWPPRSTVQVPLSPMTEPALAAASAPPHRSRTSTRPARNRLRGIAFPPVDGGRSGPRRRIPARRGHPGEAEMVAQGGAAVVAAEQPAALQFRHDEIDEIGEGAGEIGRQDVEPV